MLEVIVGRVGDGKSMYMANKIATNPTRRFCHIGVFQESFSFFKVVRTLARMNPNKKGFRLSRREKKKLKKAFGPKAFFTWRSNQECNMSGYSIDAVSNAETLERIIQEGIDEGVQDFYVDDFNSIKGSNEQKIIKIREFSKKANITLSIQANRALFHEDFDAFDADDIVESLSAIGTRNLGLNEMEIVTLRRGVGTNTLFCNKRNARSVSEVVCLDQFSSVYKELFKD